MEYSNTDLSIFSEDDRHLIKTISDAVHASGRPDQATLEQTIQDTIHRLERLAGLMVDYPSLLESQTLGRHTRDISSLTDALSHATLFTVDMILPMRAMVGQTYVMARLNLFRLLHGVVREVLTDKSERAQIKEAIAQRISQGIHARVIESLLIAIVSDTALSPPVRTKGAEALAHLWEDRFSAREEAFYPVLQATWEARRKITVQLGALMGVSEMFALMGKGGDPRFVDYFARLSCTEEEGEAFQEFLLGLSRERLGTLNNMIGHGERPVISRTEATPFSLDASFLDEHSITDFVTQLYMFFVKRHLESLTRRVSDLPGPKRTAEEYVMIYFLEREG